MEAESIERHEPNYDNTSWNMRQRFDFGTPKTTNHREG